MSDAQRFAGKVAFITGAARGQGRSEAILFASQGADIIALDICETLSSTPYSGATDADLAETVKQVEATGRKIIATKTDVRDFAALDAALSAGIEALGRLDFVVANAGICASGMSWEISPETWQEVLDVNLTGVWNTARAAIPHLLEQGEGGSMVFTSSQSGLKGTPFVAGYAASKAGVTGLTRVMANELGLNNIRVNSVHPAGVLTGMDMGPSMGPLLQEHAATLSPIFMNSLPYEMMEPEAIAHVVAWLCSDEAKYMTGAQIPVDMGNLNR